MSGNRKEKHLQLAGVVKGVHAQLRQSLKKSGGDYEAVWSDHLHNTEVLTEYAEAMHQLATDIWTKNQPETRIEWCKNTCEEYFFSESGLKKQMRKDQKREYFAKLEKGIKVEEVCCSPQHDDCSEREGTDRSSDIHGAGNAEGSVDDTPASASFHRLQYSDGHETEGVARASEIHGTSSEDESVEDPYALTSQIRLLDVGSCYNPFQHLPKFLSVGIDISPAVESVYKCDFLHLASTDRLPEHAIDAHLLNLTSPVESLPSQAFHVVVFSLLLEYFPCTYQRWVCCEKARKVLTMNGLLVIITPDSHHQNKNAPMMKSWKKAIESLGFRRWRYEKQDHLHCMAFRKVPMVVEMGSEISADMMYIPQDFNMDKEEECEIGAPEFDENFVREGFLELPGCDDL